MNLAIVTACPNGMVTSVLCARLLDAAAQRQGWSTSVEVIDVQRPERQLSQATLDAAEWVLLVSSTPLDMQRFVGKRVYQSTPAQALQDVEAVLRRGAEEAQVYVASEAPVAAKQAPAYCRDHRLPDRRGPHLHGRRSIAADRQAPGL
jgi:PTS system fructose-specific IIC component